MAKQQPYQSFFISHQWIFASILHNCNNFCKSKEKAYFIVLVFENPSWSECVLMIMVAKMMVLMKMMMMVVTIWWSSDGAIQNSSRCSRTFFPFIWPFKAAKLLVPLLFVGLISVSSATFWKPTQPSIKALKGLWKRFQPLWSVSGKTNWKLLSRNFGQKATPCKCKRKIWLNVSPKKYSNIERNRDSSAWMRFDTLEEP